MPSHLLHRNLTPAPDFLQRGGMIAEDTVRARLRALLDAGVLPRRVPRKLVGGRSEGRGQCGICDVHFKSGYIEYEVDIGQAPMPLVDRRCLELWAEEVQQDG